MPTTSPSIVTSGPPELPGLAAASNWIRLVSMRLPSGERNSRLQARRPRPPTTDGPMPNGKPTATTSSPGCRSPVERSVAGMQVVGDRLRLQHGEVVLGLRADDVGLGLGAVGEGDRRSRLAPRDHVQVGEDDAVVDDDHAGADALLHFLRSSLAGFCAILAGGILGTASLARILLRLGAALVALGLDLGIGFFRTEGLHPHHRRADDGGGLGGRRRQLLRLQRVEHGGIDVFLGQLPRLRSRARPAGQDQQCSGDDTGSRARRPGPTRLKREGLAVATVACGMPSRLPTAATAAAAGAERRGAICPTAGGPHGALPRLGADEARQPSRVGGRSRGNAVAGCAEAGGLPASPAMRLRCPRPPGTAVERCSSHRLTTG